MLEWKHPVPFVLMGENVSIRKSGPWQLSTLFALVLLLAACAAPVDKALQFSSDLDAQTFSAKRGLARLYVIQGYYKRTDNTTVITGAAPVAGAILGIALRGAIDASKDPEDRPPPPVEDPADPANAYFHTPLPLPLTVAVNDKTIGKLDGAQYFALDLAPGHYRVTVFRVIKLPSFGEGSDPNDPSLSPTLPFGEASLDLAAGQVAYLLTSETYENFSEEKQVLTCGPECQPFVRVGHRVPASL